MPSNKPKVLVTVNDDMHKAILNRYGKFNADTIRTIIAQHLGIEDNIPQHGGKRKNAGRKRTEKSE